MKTGIVHYVVAFPEAKVSIQLISPASEETATVKSQLTGILAANFGGVNTGGLLLANICNSQVGNRL